jgi:phytoene dehydrogenase-like protein
MPIVDIKGVKTQKPKKMGMGALLKMLPALSAMSKNGKLSVAEYASRFAHPALRRLMRSFVPENYSATALLFTLATIAAGDGGYPEGGSLAMTQRMADTFRQLGGKLMLGTKVKQVIIENGSATGVELVDETLLADAIIITQETIAASTKLFAVPPSDEWLQEMRANTKPVVCTFVSVGVRADIPQTPTFELSEPIMCGGVRVFELGFNNYSGYKGYAPTGGTALTAAFMGDTYDFWANAKAEGTYAAEKAALAEQISRAICAKYPQSVGRIEVIDIATPLTYERYTGAYRGSWMSVMAPGDKQRQYPNFLENVKGVYFAGHRMMGAGGLPIALTTGRSAAQMVCKQYDAVFR